MSSNMRTVVVCKECGTAIDIVTYKELFDDMIFDQDNEPGGE